MRPLRAALKVTSRWTSVTRTKDRQGNSTAAIREHDTTNNALAQPPLPSHEHATQPRKTPLPPVDSRNSRRHHVSRSANMHINPALHCHQLPSANRVDRYSERCHVHVLWLRQDAGAEHGMASQRGDAACVCGDGRLAWRATGNALLPAQDEEEGISDCVLGHCTGLGGRLVEHMDWWAADWLREDCHSGHEDVIKSSRLPVHRTA